MIRRGVEPLIAPFDTATSQAGRRFLASRPWWLATDDAPSLLALSGAPVEATYTPDASELRLTIEPSRASDPPGAKWRAARSLLGASAAAYPFMTLLRGAPEQRWGCWLSARWRAGRRTLKLYQEVTAFHHDRFLACMRRDTGCSGGIVPALVGATDDGTIEYYGHLIGPRPHTLHELLAAVGVASRLPAFLDVFGFLALRERVQLFRGVRLAAGIRASSVTLYAPVRQLFDTDATARARILALARELGHTLASYEQATRSLAQSGGGNAHGMLGITLDATPFHCSIGVAP